jgi:hypothetical protein
MRTFVRILTSLLALCFVAALGCKKWVDDSQGAAQESGDANPTAAEAEKVGEDQELGEKLNGYIRDCLNRFSRPVRSSQERYYAWVDPRRGPSGKTRKVNGIEEISADPDLCRSAVGRSNSRPPKLPEMEKKADDYAIALLQVVPIVNEAHEYYERGDYKTDRMAKAKELHPKLVGAFEAFDKAGTALSEAVDQVQEDLDKRELVRIEREEGKRARWYVVRTMVLAKPILHEIAKEPSKIHVSAAGTACQGFEGALGAFDGWAKESPEAASKVAGFLSGAKDLAVACRNLERRLKEKKPFTIAEQKRLGTSAGPSVEGSPDAVLDKYNRLIEAYNLARY